MWASSSRQFLKSHWALLSTNDKPRRVLEDVNKKKVDVRVDEAVDSQGHEIVKQELNQAEGENQEKQIQEV